MKNKMSMHEGMSHEHMSHGKMHEHGSSGMYKNEVEKPETPPFGHISAMENMGMGMHDWKGEADPISYGQASEEGCRSDEKKIHSQFKDYHWA
jgi:hypothetical protein